MSTIGIRAAAAAVLAVALGLASTGCVQSGRGETSRASGPAASCPFPVDTSITTTARIGYQDIPNGDLIVKDQSLLETCMPNAKITWSKFASGGDVVQAFGSGSLDLGTLGSSPATKALSAPLNIPMQVVWIHDVIGAAESLVVKDKSITDIRGLRGKRLATPFASTSHYSALAALSAAGIAADVQLINLAPDAIPGAWQGNQIDAAWVWDPTLSKLTADGHVVTSSAEVAAAGAPTFDLAGATASFTAANSAFMAMWTRLQNYAVGQISAAPSTSTVSIAAQLGIAPDLVTPQLRGYQYLPAAVQAGDAYLGGGFAKNLTDTAGFLLQQGGVNAVSDPQVYARGLYTTGVKEAAK